MGNFCCPQAEDCLTLNIWTPAADTQKRPVLVWLHGGAFTSGAGSLPWYDGQKLASEGDIVVVNVNYRLGAFGFLYYPGISSGNLGLLDQEAALRWVTENIENFGGDPSNITLMGQSAGAQSIALLLTRSEAGRLGINRAIVQSAPLGAIPYAPETAARIGVEFLRALEIDPKDTSASEKIREVPTDRILAAQGAAARCVNEIAPRNGVPALPFFPVADGAILPSPRALPQALTRAAGKVDLLIGSTRDEANVFFIGNAGVHQMEMPSIPAEEIARYSVRRPGGTARQVFIDYVGDHLFTLPSIEWARDSARGGRNVYVYRFDWTSQKDEIAAGHCVELPFVFGTRDTYIDAPMLAGANFAIVDALSTAIRHSWISFVRTGNPNGAGLPQWPKFTPATEALMRIDSICGAVTDHS
jgi:para-nitrobenzyl esterase